MGGRQQFSLLVLEMAKVSIQRFNYKRLRCNLALKSNLRHSPKSGHSRFIATDASDWLKLVQDDVTVRMASDITRHSFEPMVKDQRLLLFAVGAMAWLCFASSRLVLSPAFCYVCFQL